jgi:acyl-CoA reductase-like NAD-dependent aldehyde dehydrogenase
VNRTDRTDKLYLAGKWVAAQAQDSVIGPVDGSVVRRTPRASATDVEAAMIESLAARERLAALPASVRRELLMKVAAGVKARTADLKRSIVIETGKSQMMADIEILQAEETYQWAGEEVVRYESELLTLPSPLRHGYYAISTRVPVGLVVAISPFNVPTYFVNKTAPALAVGAPCILKPPPQAPGAGLIFAEIYEDAGVPAGALSVLPCGPEQSEKLATDPRVAMVSFTGSSRVGKHLETIVPRRTRLALELGNTGAAVIHEDADLPFAVKRCLYGGYALSGQLCVSVQRVLVHRAVFSRFLEMLIPQVEALKVGDPTNDPAVYVGPMINDAAADRVESWLAEAVAGGAKVLCGGARKGRYITPAVVVGAKRSDKVWCEEIFGPVLAIEAYDDFDAALDAANDSPYGLQAGVFTYDIRRIERAFRRLDVGAVFANEVPTFKSVNYPFGGVKDSGIGREGIKWAMEEYSIRKTLVMHSEPVWGG